MTISVIDFSNKGSTATSTKTLRKIQQAMACDGAVVFDDLFPMSLLKSLRSEVMRRHNSGQLRRQGLVRDIGGRYAAVLPFDGPFLNRSFYANPKLSQVMDALLGSHYCIGSLEAVISLPGASQQHQHIDGPIRFDQRIGNKKFGFRGDLSDLPPYAVTLCVPLCDLDEVNGATAIWPGSHRTALRSKPPSESQIAREFPAEQMIGRFGRSFIFDYRTYHCGMANLSREPRPLLMFVFTRSWFRDPNLMDVFPRIAISKNNLNRIPDRYRPLFMLAPAARRALWQDKKI
jgi:hypothetical protein